MTIADFIKISTTKWSISTTIQQNEWADETRKNARGIEGKKLIRVYFLAAGAAFLAAVFFAVFFTEGCGGRIFR